MNNKDLAKLLLNHPIIKKINESQMWDKSVVSRVIAEELMAEQSDMRKKVDSINYETASSKELEDLKKELEDHVEELGLEGEPGTRQEEKDLIRFQNVLSRIDIHIANAKKREEEQNNASAIENDASAQNETTPEEKELSRDELINQIKELESTISVFKDNGEATGDVEAELSVAQEKLKAIDNASKAVTKKAIESESPEVKKLAKAVNQKIAKEVSKAKQKAKTSNQTSPEAKAQEVAKAVEEIPTKPLKQAVEKIVEPQPEPQPEPKNVGPSVRGAFTNYMNKFKGQDKLEEFLRLKKGFIEGDIDVISEVYKKFSTEPEEAQREKARLYSDYAKKWDTSKREQGLTPEVVEQQVEELETGVEKIESAIDKAKSKVLEKLGEEFKDYEVLQIPTFISLVRFAMKQKDDINEQVEDKPKLYDPKTIKQIFSSPDLKSEIEAIDAKLNGKLRKFVRQKYSIDFEDGKPDSGMKGQDPFSIIRGATTWEDLLNNFTEAMIKMNIVNKTYAEEFLSSFVGGLAEIEKVADTDPEKKQQLFQNFKKTNANAISRKLLGSGSKSAGNKFREEFMDKLEELFLKPKDAQYREKNTVRPGDDEEPSIGKWDENKSTIENVKEAIASFTRYPAEDLEDEYKLTGDLGVSEEQIKDMRSQLEKLLNISLPEQIKPYTTLEQLANLIDKAKGEAEVSLDDGEEVSDKQAVETDKDKYIAIAEVAGALNEELNSNSLFKNDLFKLYVGWWLVDTGAETLNEFVAKVPESNFTKFFNSGLIDAEEFNQMKAEIDKDLENFKSLIQTLQKITNTPEVETKDGELTLRDASGDLMVKAKKDQTGELVVKGPAVKQEQPPAPQEPISKEEVQQEVEKDLSTENQTPARVYSEQQYEILATFFADKGGKGLGFMQQLLLRRQSEQLQNLIKTLEDIIDPDKGQMKSLTRGEPVNEQQEETQEPTIELEPREQRKLKTELIGLLSALKNLKTLSKAYEENMTRTSVDPRYDGSSLKARLDEMLPEIQNAIARILKMIQDFFGDLQKVEPNVVSEQQEGGLDREEKIDLVEDVYSKMRVIWKTLGPALKDTFKQEEPEEQIEEPENEKETQAENLLREKDAPRATETVIQNATDMKELATSDPFITFFPTIVFAGGGEVVSIEQANEVLSGVISEFIYVMRNVVALVKGEQITEGTAIEVKGKLADIANAIEESFGVPASKIVKQVEREMSTNEGNQALTDTPANNNEFFDDDDTTVEPEVEPELDNEGGEEAGPITLEDYIKNMMGEMVLSKPLENFVLDFIDGVERFYKGEQMTESAMSQTINAAKRLWKTMKKEDKKWANKIIEKLKNDLDNQDPILENDILFNILISSLPWDATEYISFFKEMDVISENDISSMLKDIIRRKGKIDFKEPRGSLEEALKPIIAKMLKEHYG